ncbi:MAG: hypothetical protein U0798_04130 [Gemmataceae bacterium]
MLKRFLSITAFLFVATFVTADDKPEKKTSGFDVLKSLVGTWVAVDADGKPTKDVVSVIKLTANGSAVHETLFPGQPHEMVTVYHKSGKEVLATHYCAIGNQPRYKLDAKSTDKKLILTFDGGTNFDPAKDMHMHEGTITIIDADTIEASWIGYDNGKPAEGHSPKFKLARKK